jgi:hypothetical protein
MEEFATDRLPKRWIERAKRLTGPSEGSNQAGGEQDATEDTQQALQRWLEEVYFDNGKKEAELSLDDIREVGELIRKIL